MLARGRPQTISDGELLDAARTIFLEHAVGATTAAIAKKARVSESVIFHRYKTKEALFLAVLDREARVPPILENLEGRLGKGVVDDVLFDIGMEVIEQARSTMPFFMIASTMARAAQGSKRGQARVRWNLDALRERMRGPSPAHLRAVLLLARYFAREAELGRLRRVDFDSLARVYLGALMQHVMQQYWWSAPESSSLSSSEFVRSLVDVFVRGLMLPRTKTRKRHLKERP